MKVCLLPSSARPFAADALAAVPGDRSTTGQYLTSYLVNDSIAVDAGSLGFTYDLSVQRGVRHLLLSHPHLDHLASLPIFLENIFNPKADEPPVTVYASTETIETLRRDLFNDRLWPDFIGLTEKGVAKFLRLKTIEAEVPFTIEGVEVTPIAVDHTIPTLGFLLRDAAGTLALVADTGPTERIWEAARARTDLRAVVLEAAFPNSLEWLAKASGHLTPKMLFAELEKLGRRVPTLVVHIKAATQDAVLAELAAAARPHVAPAHPGRWYDYD
ncbi:MAG: MBL fold metallo-hydrolase [Planctomycetia bacterium]